MPFEATIFIQGVGIYVPNTEKTSLLVLFPNDRRATESGLRGSDDKQLCRHHAVIQFNARNLSDDAPDVSLTHFVEGHWIGFETTAPLPPLEMQSDDAGPVGVALLDPFLDRMGWKNATIWDDALATDSLNAGFYAHGGWLGPDSEYEGLWEIPGGQVRLSGVMKLELGDVEDFSLLLRPFGSDDTKRWPLRPVGDVLDVWVRHYCDVGKHPSAEAGPLRANEEDIDFTLNYALVDGVQKRLKAFKGRLPVPRVDPSWMQGSKEGGDPRKCSASRVRPRRINSPFPR
jgi:hypothetical protein